MIDYINKEQAGRMLALEARKATNPSERVAWGRALSVLRAIKTVDGAHIDRKFTEREMGKIIVHWSSDKDWLAWRSALCTLQKVPSVYLPARRA